MTNDDRKDLETQNADLANQVRELVITSVRLHDLRRKMEERERMFRDLAVLLGERLPTASLEEFGPLCVEYVAYSANYEAVVWVGMDGRIVHEGFWENPDVPSQLLDMELAEELVGALTLGETLDYDWLASSLGLLEVDSALLTSSSGDVLAFVLYGCTEEGAQTSARVRVDKSRDDILASMFSAVSANIDSRHASEALHEAVERANQASHTKSRFVANMTHELRTPLNAIIGYTELIDEELQEQQLREGFSEELGRILQCSDHLLLLINDVLDLAKVEAGELVVFLQDFDVVEMFRGVIDGVAPRARSQGCSIVFERHDQPIVMHSDRGRLRQVFTNLLTNAVKFTEQGTVTVTLEEQADQVRFSVADTGIGMSAEALARIFEPFEQEDNSTTRRFGGTGLGLHITQQLVHLLGGEIDVTSERGVGSTFSVTLPKQHAIS